MIRVGLLGLGKMGKLHFLNAIRSNGVQVVAVSDKSNVNLKLAKAYHVAAYRDYQELLTKEDVDAVIISLPNYLKEESITLASEKKINIFVDKPLARNLSEAEKIIQRINSTKSRLMVGVNYRFIDSVQKIKTNIDSGRFGEIVISTAELIMDGPFSHSLIPKPVPGWWFNKDQAGGGALLDLGYHLLDIFQWIFGDLTILYSNLQYRYNLPLEDSATVVLKPQNTATTIVLNIGWFSKTIFPNFNFRINMHGTVGYTSTDHFAPKNLYLHALKEGATNLFRKISGKGVQRLSYTYYYSSFTTILETFFHALREDSAFPSSLEEQLNVMKIIESIYRNNGAEKDG